MATSSTSDPRAFMSSWTLDPTARDDELVVARAQFRAVARVAKRHVYGLNGDTASPLGGSSDSEEPCLLARWRQQREMTPPGRARPLSASAARPSTALLRGDGGSRRRSHRPQSTSTSAPLECGAAWLPVETKPYKRTEMLQSAPQFQERSLQRLEAETNALLQRVLGPPSDKRRRARSSTPNPSTHQMSKSRGSDNVATQVTAATMAVGSGLQVARNKAKTNSTREARKATRNVPPDTSRSHRRVDSVMLGRDAPEQPRMTSRGDVDQRRAVVEKTEDRSKPGGGSRPHGASAGGDAPLPRRTDKLLDKRRKDPEARAKVWQEMGWLEDLAMQETSLTIGETQNKTTKKTNDKKRERLTAENDAVPVVEPTASRGILDCGSRAEYSPSTTLGRVSELQLPERVIETPKIESVERKLFVAELQIYASEKSVDDLELSSLQEDGALPVSCRTVNEIGSQGNEFCSFQPRRHNLGSGEMQLKTYRDTDVKKFGTPSKQHEQSIVELHVQVSTKEGEVSPKSLLSKGINTVSENVTLSNAVITPVKPSISPRMLTPDPEFKDSLQVARDASEACFEVETCEKVDRTRPNAADSERNIKQRESALPIFADLQSVGEKYDQESSDEDIPVDSSHDMKVTEDNIYLRRSEITAFTTVNCIRDNLANCSELTQLLEGSLTEEVDSIARDSINRASNAKAKRNFGRAESAARSIQQQYRAFINRRILLEQTHFLAQKKRRINRKVNRSGATNCEMGSFTIPLKPQNEKLPLQDEDELPLEDDASRRSQQGSPDSEGDQIDFLLRDPISVECEAKTSPYSDFVDEEAADKEAFRPAVNPQSQESSGAPTLGTRLERIAHDVIARQSGMSAIQNSAALNERNFFMVQDPVGMLSPAIASVSSAAADATQLQPCESRADVVFAMPVDQVIQEIELTESNDELAGYGRDTSSTAHNPASFHENFCRNPSQLMDSGHRPMTGHYSTDMLEVLDPMRRVSAQEGYAAETVDSIGTEGGIAAGQEPNTSLRDDTVHKVGSSCFKSLNEPPPDGIQLIASPCGDDGECWADEYYISDYAAPPEKIEDPDETPVGREFGMSSLNTAAGPQPDTVTAFQTAPAAETSQNELSYLTPALDVAQTIDASLRIQRQYRRHVDRAPFSTSSGSSFVIIVASRGWNRGDSAPPRELHPSQLPPCKQA